MLHENVRQFRPLHPGMGQAVAERTYLRRLLTKEQRDLLDPDVKLNPADPHLRQWLIALHNTGGFNVSLDTSAAKRGYQPDTEWENWGQVADRVATGNASLLRLKDVNDNEESEREQLASLIAKGAVLMSGRHLQQGDANQLDRPQEVFTNCSTSATSFALFYLLLNGSGVGRCYDDDMMVTNWDHMPTVRVVLDDKHPDFSTSAHTSVRDAQHLYGESSTVHWFHVPDSREGWAEAVELLEVMTFQKIYHDEMLVIDFSAVREKDAPIMGMQGRPSSGPVPLMNALEKIAKIKGSGMKPWRQALYIDHFLAEPVLVGGARRAARMSTKHWSDPDILEFVEIKRPIEFRGMTMTEVIEYRAKLNAEGQFPPMAFLWSSNNSVTVDDEFWRRARLTKNDPDYQTPRSRLARQVLQRVAECSYGDGTGEPGFINQHLLTSTAAGQDAPAFRSGDYVGSDRYAVKDETRMMLQRIHKAVRGKKWTFIVNPCGEITLSVLGAFCVIADVVPYHCDTLQEADDAVRASVRSLMRVNLMDSLYNAEVKRTNRIGIGLTGVHEFAWKFFGVAFNDLVKPDFVAYGELVVEHGFETARQIATMRGTLMTEWSVAPGLRAAAFWDTLGSLSRSVYLEAVHYASVLGVEVPHTSTTIKPSGSVSKLFGLTEGWHLPALAFYLRWVQFRSDDPQLEAYRANGYPVRELETYKGHTIVGFPTAPAIAQMEGIEEHLVLAGDASMEDQFAWLKLGEAFWLEGNDVQSYRAGFKTLPDYGNQISYTLKYKPEVTGFDLFKQMLLDQTSGVRCVSVMPQENGSSFEYLPEDACSKAEYEDVMRAIRATTAEAISEDELNCEGGACPVPQKDADEMALFK
jgi:adenosylcobalamin-dependent ribonucleoside-triphosphate reductase